MKTKGSVLVYTTIAAMALFMMASCGNSKKNQTQNGQTAGQPMDTVTVIETETVIVAVDSIAPDTMAMKKGMTTPKKTK